MIRIKAATIKAAETKAVTTKAVTIKAATIKATETKAVNLRLQRNFTLTSYIFMSNNKPLPHIFHIYGAGVKLITSFVF